MEKLFTYLLAGTIAIPVIKILVFWMIQKLLHSNKDAKRMDAASLRISSYFNKLLKAHALRYDDINSIYNILRKYAHGRKYNNNIHLIYSVLKHEAVRRQDLGNIELILDTIARKQKIKRTWLTSSPFLSYFFTWIFFIFKFIS